MWTSGRMSNAKNLFGLGVSLYFWGLMDLTTTVLSGSARPLTEGPEDNLSDKLHQRMKRSWVWNQFFVLEEYTGTDPLYVGKVRAAPEGCLVEYMHLCTRRPWQNMGSFSKCIFNPLLSGSESIYINFTSAPKNFSPVSPVAMKNFIFEVLSIYLPISKRSAVTIISCNWGSVRKSAVIFPGTPSMSRQSKVVLTRED